MVVPVYVMFTKADLVAGFVEFFGDFGKQQRGQAVGRHLLASTTNGSPIRRAPSTRSSTSSSRPCTRACIERLSRERVPEVRSRVLQFPVEFQALRATARALHRGALPGRTPTRKRPSCAASTSRAARQVGRPLDRVLANMARGFDLPHRCPRWGSRRASQLFRHRLLRAIVFPDRHLAVRSSEPRAADR